jgi:hypothetical protein
MEEFFRVFELEFRHLFLVEGWNLQDVI